ncbi:MAG: single-stranded DNA-binding protein [Bacillota bacterium]|nr:single-stranded DNA-binding protein [Bacillota bacterium]
MFKVILCGKISSDISVKEVGDSKVCNFTVACKNSFGKYESHVRCSVWGSFVDELVNEDYKDKLVLIEGEGTNKLMDKNDGNRHYIFNVKCSRIEKLG